MIEGNRLVFGRYITKEDAQTAHVVRIDRETAGGQLIASLMRIREIKSDAGSTVSCREIRSWSLCAKRNLSFPRDQPIPSEPPV